MNLQLFATLKNYNFKNLPRDIFSGIIIAAVSIPISMGYAQIAWLPPAYGLYGSILPILLLRFFLPRSSLSLAWMPHLLRS